MKIRFIFYAFVIIFYSCANPQPPSGGPPDKTPPEILSISPASGTTNYKGSSIAIKFNKYMERNKVAESVFITPDIPLEFDWSGKSVKIKFKGDLQENTTYALSLGTEYTDLKGNAPVNAETVIFSTGPAIDSGFIAGNLIGQDLQGVFIYGYRLNEMNPDTLNINNVRPHYRTQTGSSGNFKLMALKPGNYRIFAVDDQFKDVLYSHGADRFGAAYKDYFVNDTVNPAIELKIGPAIDQAGPQITEINPLSSIRIQAVFSEPLLDTSVKASSFQLRSKSSGAVIPIIAAFLNLNDRTKVEVLTSKLDTIPYELKALPALMDTLGNHAPDTLNSMTFAGEISADTIKAALIEAPLADSVSNVRLDSAFRFVFNTAIKPSDFKSNFNLRSRETGAEIPVIITLPAENIIQAKPSANLKTDARYLLTYNSKGLSSVAGELLRDTVITYDFGTVSERSFTAVSGKIIDSVKCSGAVRLIFRNSDDSYQTLASGDSLRWNFDYLPTGDYEVEIYCDSDNNGRYSFGYPFPYKPAEYFEITPNNVSLKSRWRIEDLIFILRRKE